MNIAAHQNGINSGRYEVISGFSEAVLDYIRAVEEPVLTFPDKAVWPFPTQEGVRNQAQASTFQKMYGG